MSRFKLHKPVEVLHEFGYFGLYGLDGVATSKAQNNLL